MSFDMSRCPQTTDEARTWFYAGIGQSLGAPATNWEAIMTNCGLPPGYGPGVIPNASMPYFAFTQQFSGAPKGRIFLPSNTPDENNYYTVCYQYLDDAPGTYSAKSDPKADFKSASGLVWAWYKVAGNEYSPVQGPGSVGVPPSTGSSISREEVEAMLANYFKVDDKISLESNSGKIVCAEGGGPKVDNEKYELTARSSIGPWESFKLRRGQE